MEAGYYQTKSGRLPVKIFVNSIDDFKVKNKTLRAMQLLEEEGLVFSLSKGDSEPVPPYKNLYALRIRWKNTWYRIFFTKKGSIIYYLDVVKKQSNKFKKYELRKVVNQAKDIGCIK